MGTQKLKALLVGENAQGSSYLATRLQQRGCECEFAMSFQQAISLLRGQRFDLVLSATKLHDRSLIPLIDLLEGSDASLFYSYLVENGCWWLPALRRGRRCFGSPALLASNFVSMLDQTIEEMRLAGSMADRTAHALQGEVVAMSEASFSQGEWERPRPGRTGTRAISRYSFFEPPTSD